MIILYSLFTHFVIIIISYELLREILLRFYTFIILRILYYFGTPVVPSLNLSHFLELSLPHQLGDLTLTKSFQLTRRRKCRKYHC